MTSSDDPFSDFDGPDDNDPFADFGSFQDDNDAFASDEPAPPPAVEPASDPYDPSSFSTPMEEPAAVSSSSPSGFGSESIASFGVDSDTGSGDGNGGGSKLPTWAWIAGGVGGLLLCCGAIACSVFFYVGNNAESLLEGVQATLEADGSFGDVQATIEAAVEDGSGDGDGGGIFDDVQATIEAAAAEIEEDLNAQSSTDNNGAVAGDNPQFASSPSYEAVFNRIGFWGEGEVIGEDGTTVEAIGGVSDGRYDFNVLASEGLYWTTAGEAFGDGIYEIDTFAVDGSLNNGYGMMFMVDDDTDDFYLFEVSSDGFVWIGSCFTGCEELDMLVDEGWFESSAVVQGLNELNNLRVEVYNGNMSFYVNDQLVGEAFDVNFTSGDIGLLVETFDEGNIRIQFDNFVYTPAE